jgi:hypothetical protein
MKGSSILSRSATPSFMATSERFRAPQFGASAKASALCPTSHGRYPNLGWSQARFVTRFTLPCRGRVDRWKRSGWGARRCRQQESLSTLSPQPAALRASTFPLQGKVENTVVVAVTIPLTLVPDSVTYDLSRSPKDAFRRQAERWSGCGARGRFCTLLPGGLGISPPAR